MIAGGFCYGHAFLMHCRHCTKIISQAGGLAAAHGTLGEYHEGAHAHENGDTINASISFLLRVAQAGDTTLEQLDHNPP